MDVVCPLGMVSYRIDAKTNDSAVTLFEFGHQMGQSAKLGSAHGCKIFRM